MIKNYHDKNVLPFAEICRKLEAKENFSFARYGDGEFYAICGHSGQNCDGHAYFPAMGKALANTLIEKANSKPPGYYMGLHMSRRSGDETYNWLKANKIDYKFAQNAVFHDALIKKNNTDVKDVIRVLGRREKIIVGPAHLKNQSLLKGRFVDCLALNSWLDSNRVLKRVKSQIRKDDVVLFCSGPPSPVWISRLYDEYKTEVTLIDLGSTLDPYCGIKSRSFHESAVIHTDL